MTSRVRRSFLGLSLSVCGRPLASLGWASHTILPHTPLLASSQAAISTRACLPLVHQVPWMPCSWAAAAAGSDSARAITAERAGIMAGLLADGERSTRLPRPRRALLSIPGRRSAIAATLDGGGRAAYAWGEQVGMERIERPYGKSGGNMKTGDAIAEILKREGVEWIIGYPVNHILEHGAADGIRPIIVRQERIGLHMADAIARVTSGRKVGMFVMQHGPGTENAYGGVAQAYSESVPILVMPMGYAQRMAWV